MKNMLKNFITINPSVFGEIPKTDITGLYVKFVGKFLQNGKTEDFNNKFSFIGRIIGNKEDKIVIATDMGFIGWIDKDDYELVNYQVPYNVSIH